MMTPRRFFPPVSAFALLALFCAPIGANAAAGHHSGRSAGHAVAGLHIAARSAQNCRSATSDNTAKELDRVAEITAETIATDSNGSYTQVTPALLRNYEPLIAITPQQAGSGGAYVIAASGTTDTYTLTARASDGNTFTIVNTRGRIIRTSRVCGHTQSW